MEIVLLVGAFFMVFCTLETCKKKKKKKREQTNTTISQTIAAERTTEFSQYLSNKLNMISFTTRLRQNAFPWDSVSQVTSCPLLRSESTCVTYKAAASFQGNQGHVRSCGGIVSWSFNILKRSFHSTVKHKLQRWLMSTFFSCVHKSLNLLLFKTTIISLDSKMRHVMVFCIFLKMFQRFILECGEKLRGRHNIYRKCKFTVE